MNPRRRGAESAGASADLQVTACELLESVPDAVLGVDGDGCIAFVNAQAETMFGYQRDELVGQRIELLLPERFHAAHGRHRARYGATPTTRPMGAGLDLFARRRDGSEFPVEISLSPLDAAGRIQTVSVVRDVTRRHEYEKERERLLEVAGRARVAAEEALRSRAEAERLKDDLTNMVVHDLKNPVNGIAMMVRLLLHKGGLVDAQATKLVQIERTCRELLRLIGNVLEIAKIEAGQMPVAVESVVLAELVDEVTAEYGPVATHMGRSLRVAMDTDLPPVLADRALLKRVLVNLVANSLRHSGSADVCIEAAREAAGSPVTIRVVDHGRGIAADELGRVFEKFMSLRGDPSADTGLGLPFCKLAIERMNGTIALNSTPGVMTTFTVTLPRGNG
jgi:protein-histidine pros-kinase